MTAGRTALCDKTWKPSVKKTAGPNKPHLLPLQSARARVRRAASVLLGASIGISAAVSAFGGEVVVAVASNFVTTANVLVTDFQDNGDHDVVLVHGSTGKLYAQIVNGAPFDVFLAADTERPEMLQSAGLVQDRLAYAFGKLTFLVQNGMDGNIAALATSFPRIAVADPVTAPYGVAAKEVLVALRGENNWATEVVFGESVGQAFGFVATGNASAGFVALSQIETLDFDGVAHDVPADKYAPIRQEAVLLNRAASNPAAARFFAYLSSPQARAIIRAAGYGLAD